MSAVGYWLLLHLLGVVLFLGNIVTGVLWAERAWRSGNRNELASVMRGVRASDAWFTMPGVGALVAGGVGAAMSLGQPILGTGWILWSVVLVTLSGVVFMARVGPLQKSIAAAAAAAGPPPAEDAALARQFRAWRAWGMVATVAPFAAFVLMVLKPELWAL